MGLYLQIEVEFQNEIHQTITGPHHYTQLNLVEVVVIDIMSKTVKNRQFVLKNVLQNVKESIHLLFYFGK